MVNYLRECTSPKDRVFAPWFVPELYFFSQRGFVGSVATFDGHWSEPRFQERIIDSFVVTLRSGRHHRNRASRRLRRRVLVARPIPRANTTEVAGTTDFGNPEGNYTLLVDKNRISAPDTSGDRDAVLLSHTSMPLNTTRSIWLPIACALAYVAASAWPFSGVSWPYVDVYLDHSRSGDLDLAAVCQVRVHEGRRVPAALALCIKLVYELVGLRPWVYQLLVVAQFGPVLGLVIWLFKPAGMRRAVAACIALSCIVGLHSAHILFGYWPSNIHSPGLHSPARRTRSRVRRADAPQSTGSFSR